MHVLPGSLCYFYGRNSSSVRLYSLCPSSPSDLDHLTGRLIITPQNGPAGTVGLCECHLELCAQYSELALVGLDGSEQGELGLVALVVRRSQVKID